MRSHPSVGESRAHLNKNWWAVGANNLRRESNTSACPISSYANGNGDRKSLVALTFFKKINFIYVLIEQ